MKRAQIQVGSTYLAKVSGQIVRVLVERIEQHSDYKGRTVYRYYGRNLNTKRPLFFRSAARFRDPL